MKRGKKINPNSTIPGLYPGGKRKNKREKRDGSSLPCLNHTSNKQTHTKNEVLLWQNYPKVDCGSRLVTWLLIPILSCLYLLYPLSPSLSCFILLTLFFCLCLFYSLYQGLSQALFCMLEIWHTHCLSRAHKMVVVNDDGGQDQGWGQDTHFGKSQTFYFQKHFTTWRTFTIPKRFW